MDSILQQREQQVLYDQKWRKFLRRARLFRWIPFLDFVLGAGSMATGDVAPDSDFDVIVGARKGRIFTVRACCVLLFGLFGWRRKRLNHAESAADKICLNHFVTSASYALRPPYDASWQRLYANLVPVFGGREKIEQFFAVNESWLLEPRRYSADSRHRGHAPNIAVRVAAYLLSGRIGNIVERLAKAVQVRRIERSLAIDPPGHKPRIVYTDSELEFHPDTRKFEDKFNE